MRIYFSSTFVIPFDDSLDGCESLRLSRWERCFFSISSLSAVFSAYYDGRTGFFVTMFHNHHHQGMPQLFVFSRFLTHSLALFSHIFATLLLSTPQSFLFPICNFFQFSIAFLLKNILDAIMMIDIVEYVFC